ARAAWALARSTAALVVVGSAGRSVSSTVPPPARKALLITLTASARSSSRPSRGWTTTGRRFLKVTRPSVGGLSTVLASASTVLASWEASTLTLGSRSVVPVSARHTSNGLGKPLGTWLIVLTTSSWSPASSG